MSGSDGSLSGQTIAVVGGTSGIGAAIARLAAAAGAQVTAAGRQQLDIASESSIRDYFQALGPIDHLVVTAAFVRPGPFRTGDVADARLSMEGKFWSQYLCVRHAQVRRSILLFSGIYSRRPSKGVSIIAAVNGAVEALGRGAGRGTGPGARQRCLARAGPRDGGLRGHAGRHSRRHVRGSGGAAAGRPCRGR